MKDTLKLIGGYTLYACGLFAVFMLGMMLFTGGVWLSERAFPWLVSIGTLAFFVTVFVFLPLALFRRTRVFAGNATFLTSYVFGLNLWVYGLLLTYTLWGIGAVVVGLFIMGVGVVPIAMLATLFKGLWGTLGELVLLTAMTFGSRFLGLFILTKAEFSR